MTNKSDQIDSDYDVEGKNKLKNKRIEEFFPAFFNCDLQCRWTKHIYQLNC